LTQQAIDDMETAGKVGFGTVYSERLADSQAAVAAALQGFEDGLYKVLINDLDIIDLEAKVDLKSGDILTFIRLTFLSGRMW
jgi:hypothetical protein